LDFTDVLKKSIKAKPSVNKWFYVSARLKEDGSFAGAIFLEEEHSVSAAMKGMNLIANADLSLTIGEYAEVPSKNLPPEHYRNRKLTLEEVEQLTKKMKK
jgi:hypothetical protein